VTRRPCAQRIAEHLIRRACRHLPGDTRDERYREWTAEIPAILHDRAIRPSLLRSAHALSYAIGILRSTHRLPGPAGLPPQETRQPAIFPRPAAGPVTPITGARPAGPHPPLPGSPAAAAAG
jgi:hypothetical protein